MGMMKALALAEMEDFSIYEQVQLHLATNCYPPVPSYMVEPCVNAIDLMVMNDPDSDIKLPEGVTFRGRDWATPLEITEHFRLWAWIGE